MDPRKSFIKNLVGSTLEFVWVFGKVEQTVGSDILIVNDGTARAKIIDCSSATQANSSTPILKGTHCSIIGSLVKNKTLPEIQAEKIINYNENINFYESFWKIEVEDVNKYLDGKMLPVLS